LSRLNELVGRSNYISCHKALGEAAPESDILIA